LGKDVSGEQYSERPETDAADYADQDSGQTDLLDLRGKPRGLRMPGSRLGTIQEMPGPRRQRFDHEGPTDILQPPILPAYGPKAAGQIVVKQG